MVPFALRYAYIGLFECLATAPASVTNVTSVFNQSVIDDFIVSLSSESDESQTSGIVWL